MADDVLLTQHCQDVFELLGGGDTLLTLFVITRDLLSHPDRVEEAVAELVSALRLISRLRLRRHLVFLYIASLARPVDFHSLCFQLLLGVLELVVGRLHERTKFLHFEFFVEA